jgi:hypothetical protein
MTPGEQYRVLAASLRARARTTDGADFAAEWEQLAFCYDRLAEQADKNERLNVTYDPILNPTPA